MINENAFFRRDVDVLRGLAVLLVVLFHLDISLFQSGFIGVDIFFVLSGYLIASIYSKNQGAIDFYERRFRRILPAMMVILLLSLLLSPLFFLPFEVKIMTDSVVGSLLFVPNLIFWRDNDYFADLHFSPLLHYWSLGVELQYYLVFPLLIWAARKVKYSLFLMAVLSFIFCVILTHYSSKSAFFFLPSRLWEFLLGYFAFELRNSLIVNRLQTAKYSGYIANFSLLALLVASFLPIPNKSFPGLYALIPVLLSFAYILIGVRSEAFLESSFIKAVRWLAKISFSIYLIHYPVIFIFKYAPFSKNNELTVVEVIFAIIITIFLSVISYKFIESPLRNKKVVSLKGFLVFLVGIYFVIAATLFVFFKVDYFNDFYHKDEAKIFNAMSDRGAWRCSKWQKIVEYNKDSCYIVAADLPVKVVYLVGDSHIDVLKDTFIDIAKDKNFSLRLNRNACSLGRDQCSYEHISKEVSQYSVTDVVMHGYDYSKFDYLNMDKLVAHLKEQGVRLHIIGPVPTYDVSVPWALYEEIAKSKKIIDRLDKDSFRKKVPDNYIEFENMHSDVDGLFFYHPEKILCHTDCLLMDDKGVLYFDSNHLTLTGSNKLYQMIFDVLSK